MMTKKEIEAQEALGLMHQCQALNMDGVQCAKMTNKSPCANHGISEYHNNYDDTDAQWVSVYLCDTHRKATHNDRE